MNITDARIIEATPTEYHASPGLSHSQLRSFADIAKGGPAYYHALHVAKTLAQPKRDYFDFGSATHEEILLGEMTGRVVEIPAEVLAKKKGEVCADGAKSGNAWREWRDSQPVGSILLKRHELDVILRMKIAVMSHPAARRLIDSAREMNFIETLPREQTLRGGEVVTGNYVPSIEVPILGIDVATGIETRCCIDLIPNTAAVVDLKTSADISPARMAYTILDNGIYTQLEWYRAHVESLLGHDVPTLVIAVSKPSGMSEQVVAEWLPRVEVYDVTNTESPGDEYRAYKTGTWRDLAAEWIEQQMGAFAECVRSGAWELPGAGTIRTLAPPRKAFWTEDYQL